MKDIGEILNKVRGYVESVSLAEFGENNLNDKTDLFEEGYVDSFGFVELISFLESEFDIHFDEDLMLDLRLASIGGISNVVSENINKQSKNN